MSFQIENGVLKKYTAEPGVTRVEIPEGVTEIACLAFPDWKEVKELILPDSMTELKGQALCGCNALAHLHLSAGVTQIDLFRFNTLRSLEEITVSENNSCFCSLDGVLYTKDMKTLVLCPLCKSSITIPESITCIGEYALAGCFQITEIRFPAHLTAIKSHAFYGCGIREAIIPESVNNIETGAFYYCRDLSIIKLPDGITEIAGSAFDGCRDLTEISIPDSVTKIGSDAFDSCRKLSSVSIPDSVSSIGSNAFRLCEGLTNVILPDRITEIADNTFFGCSALRCITIPESVQRIGSSALGCCNALSVIKLHPDDPEMVRDYRSIRYLEEAIQTGSRILQTGDTGITLDHKIKYTFIVLHYLRTKDSRFKLYIQKNFQKIMKKCIACGDTDVIRAFAETDDFITGSCIDKYIQRALDSNQQEIYDILTAYSLRVKNDI